MNDNYNDLLNEIDDVLNTKKELEQIEFDRLKEECEKLMPMLIPLKDEIKTLLEIRYKLKLPDISSNIYYDYSASMAKSHFKTSSIHFFTYENFNCEGFEILLNNNIFVVYPSRYKYPCLESISCNKPSIYNYLGSKRLADIITLVKGFINDYERIKELLFSGIIEKLKDLHIQNEELMNKLNLIKRTTVTVTVTEEYI